VATSALRTDVPAEARAAVLAHEFAHLRSRHDRVLAVCDVMARALPFVPLFRRAPTAVAALIEADADMSAARVTSTAAVRSALAHVTGQGVGPGTPMPHSTRYRLLMLENGAIEPTKSTYAAASVLPLLGAALCTAAALPVLSVLVHGLTA